MDAPSDTCLVNECLRSIAFWCVGSNARTLCHGANLLTDARLLGWATNKPPFEYVSIWGFPKIGAPPNHPF